MKIKSKKTLAVIFMETLKNPEISGLIPYELYNIYKQMFSLFSEEYLNLILQAAYRDRKHSWWFEQFHKSMRNTDFFHDCYKFEPNPTISKKEQKELDKLNAELKLVYEKMDKFEKKHRKALPSYDHPTYVQKLAEYDIKYKAEFRKLFPQEKLRRRLTLKGKLEEEAKKDISGHLDCVLHSVISTDNQGVLSTALRRTFNEYLFQKQNKKLAVA